MERLHPMMKYGNFIEVYNNTFYSNSWSLLCDVVTFCISSFLILYLYTPYIVPYKANKYLLFV